MTSANIIQGKGLITTIQKAFLALFSKLPDQEHFYLTGGTALAEYYLGHRLSFDLDFFTSEEQLILPLSYQIEKLSSRTGLQINVIRRFSTFVEFVVNQNGDSLRVDLGLDSPFRFLPPVLSSEGVFVNSYEDLCVDKLLAYYGRAEPRDAVDLHFVLQDKPLEELMEQAAEKDSGFDLYWFAVALNQSADFPIAGQ
jgi:predicted nucleotidyltransferase component of viral defense system